MKGIQTKKLAIAVVGSLAIAGSVAFALRGSVTSADDWRKHGPEKLSSLVGRVAGGNWSVDWEAGSDPVVDPNVLWKNGVLMTRPEDSYDAVRKFLSDVSAVDPAVAFAACMGRHNVLKIVPMDRAVDDDCKKAAA